VGGVERVDVDALSSLIYAGWLPQDGTFESELAAGLEIERDLLRCNVIAHSTDADHSQTLAETFAVHLDGCGCCAQSGMTANDQHQPASSRAIAVLATTGRFLRWSNPAQRACSR
jgi:hypothetical protein